MFCEYCGSHLTGQETECPRCHRRTGFAIQAEVFRNGRGVPVGAYKEEDVRSKLMPPAASPSHTVRHRPEGSTVQPKPSKDYGPELEEMRNSYSRLSKDYDQTRRQLELTERQNEKLRRRSLAGGIALLLVSIALIMAAVFLILHALRPKDGGDGDGGVVAAVTETPTPEPVPSEAAPEEPEPDEEPTTVPEMTDVPTTAPAQEVTNAPETAEDSLAESSAAESSPPQDSSSMQESETDDQQKDDGTNATPTATPEPALTTEPTEAAVLTPTPTPVPTEKTESSRPDGKVTDRGGRIRTPVPEEILGIDLKL